MLVLMMLKCKKCKIIKRIHLNINGGITKDYINSYQDSQRNQNKSKDVKEVSFSEENLMITNEKIDIFGYILFNKRYFL